MLIVGGGDGEILNYLPNKLELQISYVELSSNMITIAKNRSIDVEVSFYNRDIRSFEGDHDVVIANLSGLLQ